MRSIAADGLKLPPQNLEAELSVLGSMMLDNATIDDVATLLRAEDFYRDSHQVVFRAIRDIHDLGRPVDAITVVDELARRGTLEKAGGEETIRQALEDIPSTANAVYHAQIVRQRAVSRNLIEACNRTITSGYSNNFTADELLAAHEEELARIADGSFSGRLVTLSDAARDSLRRFDLRLGGEEQGVATGLAELDLAAGPFLESQLIVIGARPGQGKTSLALNIAEYVSKYYGRVLFFSLEMGMGELGDRTVCGETRIDSVEYRKAERLRAKRDWIARKIKDMGEIDVHIDDTASVTPSHVASVSRRMARKKEGIKLVIVDYLQIMGGDNRKDEEYARVGKAATALKNLSKTLKCPVLALSQLSRKCEERPDKRPMMSDLRATGQIEQDADKILFIYREEKYFPGQSAGTAEIIVAKNRAGATGMARVGFDAKLTKFQDLVPNLDPAQPCKPY